MIVEANAAMYPGALTKAQLEKQLDAE